MPEMYYIDPDDMPEEIRAQMQKQHDLHNMNHISANHEMRDFLASLNKDQLMVLRDLVHHVGHGTAEPNPRAAFYVGRISQILEDKHGLCSCGTDHDKDAAEMFTPQEQAESKKPPVYHDLVHDLVRKLADGEGTRKDMQDIIRMRIAGIGTVEDWSPAEIAAATADAMQMLDELNPNQPAQVPPITFTDHNQVLHTWINGEWVVTPQEKEDKTPLEPFGEPREALLKRYNVLDIPVQFPQVTCAKGCGTKWISLSDRMLRDPDECGGCQNKSAWG